MIKIDDHEAWLVTELFSRVLDDEEVDMFEGDTILREDCREFWEQLQERRGFKLYEKENDLWGV